MQNFPIRKYIGIDEDTAVRLALAVEARSKTETHLIREFLEVGLSSWEAAQAPKGGE